MESPTTSMRRFGAGRRSEQRARPEIETQELHRPEERLGDTRQPHLVLAGARAPWPRAESLITSRVVHLRRLPVDDGLEVVRRATEVHAHLGAREARLHLRPRPLELWTLRIGLVEPADEANGGRTGDGAPGGRPCLAAPGRATDCRRRRPRRRSPRKGSPEYSRR